ncbi:MAG: hypothetical protein RMJ86_11150, partial [Anaerolineae bacterium]|nr:hypothetical protein [Anaerolineae bacterium]
MAQLAKMYLHASPFGFKPEHRPALASLAVVLISLTTLAIFHTSSLDDFDSLNFANALESGFAPQRGLPHPPGYFSYVFSVRALAELTGDVPSALTWFSALSG